MGEDCPPGNVADRVFAITGSHSKLMAGEMRCCIEFGENSESASKRLKMRGPESMFHSEGNETSYPKSSENDEAKNPILCPDEENTEGTKETVTTNSDVGQTGITRCDTLSQLVKPKPKPLDSHTRVCVTSHSVCGDTPAFADKLSSSGKHGIENDVNFATSRGFGWDLNAEDVSSSHNQEPFYNYRRHGGQKARDASECGSTAGPLEDKDSLRAWKEMKQNGFLSSSHGVIPVPKMPRRKSKSDGLKKKMELAKREQVDRFAKIAAPSGLLNELNPGIINHVRNSKQVHSIIEALVRSEKLENRRSKGKQGIQTTSGSEEISDGKEGVESVNGLGMNRSHLSCEYGSLVTLPGNQQIEGCSISFAESLSLNSKLLLGNGDSRMLNRTFGNAFCQHSKPNSKDDVLALKLPSSSAMGSENTSSLSNEESANVTSVSALSVKAANVASQWLELLHQDIKGRLGALRRSKKRVRSVIHMELPFLISKEFSSNQENDSRLMKHSAAICSNNAIADVHQTRWGTLFVQMDKALAEEEKQLEIWLNQVKQMQLYCTQGLQNFQHNTTHDLLELVAFKNDYRSTRGDALERDLAVRAAAASIYSTCNFLSSMENPHF